MEARDRSRFTADSNPVTNIDPGLTRTKELFFLTTGGETANTTIGLSDIIALPKDARPPFPKDLPVK